MSQANYRVTITDHDYHYTTYTAWVSASSRNQALVKAAALAGQEKARREFDLTGGYRGVAVEGLLEPEVKLEAVSLDEYWEHREQVTAAS